MLTGIIGDKVTVDDLKVKYKPEVVNRSKSPKEDSKKIAESPRSEEKDDDRPAYNFVHYDPEMHWCKTCDIFPKTAKEYLNHLHCNEHKETCLVSWNLSFGIIKELLKRLNNISIIKRDNFNYIRWIIEKFNYNVSRFHFPFQSSEDYREV